MKKIFLAFLFIVSSFNYAQAISLSEALFEAYKNNPELNAERENLNVSEEDFNTSETKQLIGYRLIDINKKHIGEIVNIINNYQQDLIEVMYIEKKLLIPYVDEMIIQINHDEKVIEMELPDGILDL